MCFNTTKIWLLQFYSIFSGCLAQLGFAELDGTWAKVADAIENLVTNNIQSANGVLKSIKSIDSDLSNSIMNILNKGSELEEKVCILRAYLKNSL